MWFLPAALPAALQPLSPWTLIEIAPKWAQDQSTGCSPVLNFWVIER